MRRILQYSAAGRSRASCLGRPGAGNPKRLTAERLLDYKRAMPAIRHTFFAWLAVVLLPAAAHAIDPMVYRACEKSCREARQACCHQVCSYQACIAANVKTKVAGGGVSLEID